MDRGHDGRVVAQSKGYDIIECKGCGFIHLRPFPERKALEGIYPVSYYAEENTDWIDKTLKEKRYWDTVYNHRYAILERFVPPHNRRILDVGSFLGLFLKKGKERGWEVMGIEPSEQGVRYATGEGITTLKGFYEDFGEDELGHFGAVNLSLTLEHVIDPVLILNKTYRLLFPGGVVLIEVPNDFNPLQEAVVKVLNKPEWWLAPPHHINYFSFSSLSRLLERLGYSIRYVTTTFPMEFFILMGDDYVGNDPFGRVCHQKRMSFEMNLERAGLGGLKEELYSFLAEKGIGREAVIYAGKDVG